MHVPLVIEMGWFSSELLDVFIIHSLRLETTLAAARNLTVQVTSRSFPVIAALLPTAFRAGL